LYAKPEVAALPRIFRKKVLNKSFIAYENISLYELFGYKPCRGNRSWIFSVISYCLLGGGSFFSDLHGDTKEAVPRQCTSAYPGTSSLDQDCAAKHRRLSAGCYVAESKTPDLQHCKTRPQCMEREDSVLMAHVSSE